MADINAPQTIWRPGNGNGEAVTTGTTDFVDESGSFLVDESGNYLIDSGTDFNAIPATVWSEDDSK